MLLTARIDNDYKCLKSYFQKLFNVMHDAIKEDKSHPLKGQDYDSDESQATYHSFTYFIKPDMLMNIYSL